MTNLNEATVQPAVGPLLEPTVRPPWWNMRRTKNKQLGRLQSMLVSLESREQNSWTLEKASALAWALAEHARLTRWIAEHGEQTDTCTRNVLGEICNGCRCGAAAERPNVGANRAAHESRR